MGPALTLAEQGLLFFAAASCSKAPRQFIDICGRISVFVVFFLAIGSLKLCIAFGIL